MTRETNRTWRFFGFESKEGDHPVQSWFNDLPVEAQEEIVDLCEHLRVRTDRQWRKPEFDPLDGEGGISELRPQTIRGAEGSVTYRLYGCRGIPDKWSYTFLHGTRKEVKNDKQGKALAKRRLRELMRGRARVHRFGFEGEADSKA